MIQLILFLFVGIGFSASLYFFLRNRSTVEGSAHSLLEARRALSELQLNLLPPEIVGRIFSRVDFDYVINQSPEHVQELFLSERRKIALAWVKQLREEIVSLRQFHLGAARFYSRLDFRQEVALAYEFGVLLCVCHSLQIALQLLGPFGVPRMVGVTAASAVRLCDISEKSLSFLKTGPFGAIGEPTRDQTAL